MKVTRAAQPLLPLCRRLLPCPPLAPVKLAGASLTLLKATALEIAILTGHLILYPSGICQERRIPAPSPSNPTRTPRPRSATSGSPPSGTPDTSCGPRTPEPLVPRGTHLSADADTPRLPVPARPPVVLLHGFIDNRSVFVLLRRSLAQQGARRLVSLNYSPLTCDIRTAADLLGRHVEELCERTDSARVDIVGHSLGGLIARYYVQRLGGDSRVRTLVTLGTPHAGTRVAPLANAHPIVRQMRPGSPVIEELAAPAPGCRTHFVSFWSDLDRVMVPLETARLDHPDLTVENVRVSGIGHLALPVHPAVAHGIRQALDAPPAAAGPGGHTGGLTVA